MKKSIASFILVILMIALLISVALFGVRAWGIPGVFDEGGISLGLDLAGGSSILYEAVGAAPSADDLNGAIQMIRHRLDNLMNLTEATVTSSGNRQILVEIPGISDPEEAVKMLGAAAVLTFRDADGNVVMDGSDVRSAVARYEDAGRGYDEWHISLTFHTASIGKFAEATRRAAGRTHETDENGRPKNYISIYLDEEPISAPSVEREINSDSCVISGDYTKERAEYEAGIINAGQLPFTLREVQLSATGPSLGMRSLQTSLFAGAIGMILIMLFMIAYYRLPGLISAIALIAYTAIVGIVLVISPVNLSLPGIAGIILSIGMAVDANVIIFERIKEELRSGRSLKNSIESGFKRAIVAIIDSNLTTLIVAVVLWNFGTGPIVGFAMTLFIGVLVSMFTAISVTRWLLNQIVGMNVRSAKLYGL